MIIIIVIINIILNIIRAVVIKRSIILGLFLVQFVQSYSKLTCKIHLIMPYAPKCLNTTWLTLQNSQNSYLKLAFPNKRGFYSNYTYTFRTKTETSKWGISDKNLGFCSYICSRSRSLLLMCTVFSITSFSAFYIDYLVLFLLFLPVYSFLIHSVFYRLLPICLFPVLVPIYIM